MEYLDKCDNVVMMGVNCVKPTHNCSLIRIAKAATSKRVLTYPNSGEEFIPETNGWKGCVTDVENFASCAKDWYECGATTIGGCCRTGPEHICELRKIADEV